MNKLNCRCGKKAQPARSKKPEGYAYFCAGCNADEKTGRVNADVYARMKPTKNLAIEDWNRMQAK